MNTLGFDPSTGLPTSKTYAGQSSPTDTTAYNSKFQLQGTSHGTVTGGGGNFVYNPAGELTGNTLLDTSTDATLTSSTPVINQKGQPNVFSTSYVDPTNGLTNSATNVLAYTAQDQVGSESFSTIANDKVVYDYYQPGDTSANASPGSIKDMKIETANGTVLAEDDYAYEPASKRLLNITVKGANSGSDEVFNYGYQLNSNLIASVGSSSGLTTGYAYQPTTGRLSSINAINTVTDQTDFNAVYAYNANDQRSNQTVSQINPDGSGTNYTSVDGYNSADELSTVTNTAITGAAPPNQNYNFDGAGNRTELGAVNLANQYIADTYDSRGNLTDDGTSSYAYNPADQLISVTPDHPTASSLKCTFAYDAMGNRAEKDVYAWSGNGWVFSYARKWVYDGTNAVAEFDGSNNLLAAYAWGQNGNLLAITDYSNPAVPHVYMAVVDGSGNVTELIDGASGAVAASFQVDPYGKLLNATGPAANLCPFVWQGHYRDSEAGLIFAPNRVALPTQGRWLQRDPSGEAGGLNLYIVDGGDPINMTDKSGLDDLPTLDLWKVPVFHYSQHLNTVAAAMTGSASFQENVFLINGNAYRPRAFAFKSGPPTNANPYVSGFANEAEANRFQELDYAYQAEFHAHVVPLLGPSAPGYVTYVFPNAVPDASATAFIAKATSSTGQMLHPSDIELRIPIWGAGKSILYDLYVGNYGALNEDFLQLGIQIAGIAATIGDVLSAASASANFAAGLSETQVSAFAGALENVADDAALNSGNLSLNAGSAATETSASVGPTWYHGTDEFSALDISQNGPNADMLEASNPVDPKGLFVTDRLDWAQHFAEQRTFERGLQGSGTVLEASDEDIGYLLKGDGTKLNEAYIPKDELYLVGPGVFRPVAP